MKENFFLERSYKKKVKISITPLIDIIFLLIVFFMMSSNFESLGTLNLQYSSDSITDSAVSSKKLVKITLLTGGKFILSDNTYFIKDAEKHIKDILNSDKGFEFLLEVSKGALVQDLVSVIDIIKSLGINDISVTDKDI